MNNSGETIRTVAVASDHAGFPLKQAVMAELEKQGVRSVDLGCTDEGSVDYPDFGYAMAQTLASGQADQGVIICGSGVGISIAANRYRHVRAALCQTAEVAKLSRQHNDANVLALGARIISEDEALECLRAFLGTEFEGGRHARRVEKLTEQGSNLS